GAAVDFSVSATDLVDGTVPVSCVPASGSTFPLGQTTVDCSATDAHGNTGNGSFTVTVQDTTGPDITVPNDFTVAAEEAGGANVAYSVSATDLVDGTVTPTCTPASGSFFPIRVNDVTCTATDSRGNESSATFKVTVRDTTPPKLTVPGDKTVDATGPDG